MSTVSKYLKPSNYIDTFNGLVKIYIVAPILYPIVWSIKKLGFMHYSSYYIHGAKDRLKIGNKSAVGNTIFNTRGGNITLGRYVIFGHNNMLLTGAHNYHDAIDNIERIYEVYESGYDINVGDGTLLGSGAIILGGVTIGKHCVVGAGSVVVKSIPDYTMVAGIPAKIIKTIK